MNKIRLNQLLLAGLTTFFAWVAVEFLLEQVLGAILFGDRIALQILQATNIANWGVSNYVLNIAIALTNCMLLIWLYASLRPMFGVGTRTALITSAFGLILEFSIIVNAINLGLISAQLGLVEWAYEAIEFPLAMIAGAYVYERAGASLAVQ